MRGTGGLAGRHTYPHPVLGEREPVRRRRRPSGWLVAALAVVSVLGAPAAARAAGSGPPQNTEPPSLAGQDKEGNQLTAKNGTWTGATPIAYSYAWERDEKSDWIKLAGVSGNKYTLQYQDVGAKLRATVTATNSAGEGRATTDQSETISAAVPKNIEPPAVTPAQPYEGQTLTVSAGKWEGTPASKYVYEWELCVKNCVLAATHESLAETDSYHLTSGSGSTVRVTVTDVNPAGSKPARAPLTEAIKGGKPVNETLPIIVGESREGKTLTAEPGSWYGAQAISYTYEWLSCSVVTGACMPLLGATGPTYTLTAAQSDETIEVTVIAENGLGSTPATSAPTQPVSSPPVNTIAPAISGNVEEDETLSVSNGSWENAGSPFGYQWLRCNQENDCEPILGATSASHVVSWQDVGMTLKATVTASSGSGPLSETSSESSRVPGGTEALGWGVNYPAEQLGSGIQSNFESSPVAVVGIEDVKQMAVVIDSSFALLADGTVKSWGGSEAINGVLGDDSFHKTSTKVSTGSPRTVFEEAEGHELKPLEHVTMLAAAGAHVLALLEDGHVATWGTSEAGERGNGESGTCYGTTKCVIRNGRAAEWFPFKNAEERGFVPRDVAYQVPGLSEVVDIAAGGATDYALLKNGTVEAWGANTKGMLGVDWIGSGPKKGPFVCNNSACITTPRAVCAVNAKLREEPEVPREQWPCENVLEGVTAISAGAETAGHEGTAYAISHGRLVAWGNDKSGQVGNGSTATEVIEPTYVDTSRLQEEGAIPEGDVPVAVAGGNNFALALLADGRVIGWGKNGVGVIGGESKEACLDKQEAEKCQLTPKLVGGLDDVSEIAAGVAVGFAVSDGTAYGIGYAEHGQLGLGKPPEEPSPQDICGGVECRREWSPLTNVGQSVGRPVSQIVADSGPNLGGTHDFVVTAGKKPPLLPQMSLTAGVGTLQLAWRFGEWYEASPGRGGSGKQEYAKVKWQKVPTPAQLRPHEDEEDAAEEAKLVAEEGAYEAAHEGETQQAEAYEREAAEDKARLKELVAGTEKLYKEVSKEDPWQLGHAPTNEVEVCEELAPCEATMSEYFGQPFGSEELEGMKVEERYEVKVEENEEKEGGYKKVYGTPEL